jgi:hypothetical protein
MRRLTDNFIEAVIYMMVVTAVCVVLATTLFDVIRWLIKWMVS